MDIENEQTDSRRNALLIENYSVSQHENLAIFDAIPKAAETPDEFLSFAFHCDARRIPRLIPVQRAADNYFTSLPRMFEAQSRRTSFPEIVNLQHFTCFNALPMNLCHKRQYILKHYAADFRLWSNNVRRTSCH